jgi:hypothetical protein
MPWVSGGSGSGGLTKLFDSTLSGSAASIDSGAAGFSTSYDDLYIDILARTDEAVVFSTLAIIFNNDSAAHYDYSLSRNRNTTLVGATANAQTSVAGTAPGASAAASFAGVSRITIFSYGQTTFNKAGEMTYGFVTSAAAGAEVGVFGFSWESTSAINRVKLSVAGGPNLLAGSRLLIRAA